jgi:uncharacterized protein YkwD
MQRSSSLLSFGASAACLLQLVSAWQPGTKTGPEGWVEDHNYFRCMHNAEPLKWDTDLAKKAQDVVDDLRAVANAKADKKVSLVHSNCYYTWPFSGENLALGTPGSKFTCNGKLQEFGQACVVWSWWNEYTKFWNCKGTWNEAPFHQVGHLTALVWKGIGSVGCANNGGIYSCEYGHDDCKTVGSNMGGAKCYSMTPQHLPNFSSCKGDACVGCYDASREQFCRAQTSGGDAPVTTSSTTTKVAVTTTSSTTTKTPATTTAAPKPATTTAAPGGNGAPTGKCTDAAGRATANTRCASLKSGSYCKFNDKNLAGQVCQSIDVRCGC